MKGEPIITHGMAFCAEVLFENVTVKGYFLSKAIEQYMYYIFGP